MRQCQSCTALISTLSILWRGYTTEYVLIGLARRRREETVHGAFLLLGVVRICIQARVHLQAIAASNLPPCTTLRQDVCVAAMLSDLLLLFLVDLVVSWGGNLCPQALSHARVILIDSADLVLCARAAHRRGSDTIRGGHSMLAA